MKKYLLKSLKDTLLIWVILEVGIVISAVFYAVLKIEGTSENTSLLIAFIILVGLIVLGLMLFPTDSYGLTQTVKKWVLGKQKPVKQLESLVEEQNILLERLTQNIEYLAQNVVPGNTFSRQLQDRFVDISSQYEVSTKHQISVQYEILEVLKEGRREERDLIEQLAQSITLQQKSFEQAVKDINFQKENHEQPEGEQLLQREQVVRSITEAIMELPESQRNAVISALLESVLNNGTQQPQEASQP